jgi:hypothetical protein
VLSIVPEKILAKTKKDGANRPTKINKIANNLFIMFLSPIYFPSNHFIGSNNPVLNDLISVEGNPDFSMPTLCIKLAVAF